MGELEAHQMIAIRVRDAQGAGAQIAGRLGQRIGHSQRRTGDLQQNLRGERQRAAYSHERTTGGNIKRGGELQEFFALFVAAANKHRDSDRETRPFAPLCFRILTLQTDPFEREIALLSHLGGQTSRTRGIV